ncbi:NUDIX domain-containing protein [Streptomyces sp. SID3343]|nr:NUDIX domain-containing protein [Streptomyces sp. SID3343]
MAPEAGSHPTRRLPPAEYYASLPRHIAAAGVILRDDDHRILLVEPLYGDGTWEIPGGGADPGELPWDTARREIAEELGLDLTPGRLLAVDWVPALPDGRPALANHVFDGGTLGTADAEHRIRLDRSELRSWRFAEPSAWQRLMAPHMARRLDACARALTTGETAYLHCGIPPNTS